MRKHCYCCYYVEECGVVGRQLWVHPIIENNNESQFKLLYTLRMYEDKFFIILEWLSMHSIIYYVRTNNIQWSDTTMRKSIQADERLGLTIR